MARAGRSYIDVRGLRRFRASLRADLRGSGRGPVHRVFQTWGERYLYATRQRFLRSSRGGEWEELKGRTQVERKKLGFQPARPILIRLGVLLRALYRGAPGNLFRRIRNGIRVGFGGNTVHPGYAGKPNTSRITIEQIAEIHQNGAGNVPQRQILHAPSAAVRSFMRFDLRVGFAQLLRQSSIGRP